MYILIKKSNIWNIFALETVRNIWTIKVDGLGISYWSNMKRDNLYIFHIQLFYYHDFSEFRVQYNFICNFFDIIFTHHLEKKRSTFIHFLTLVILFICIYFTLEYCVFLIFWSVFIPNLEKNDLFLFLTFICRFFFTNFP